MKEIKYAPDAADKLRGMKKAVAEQYGEDKAIKILKTIIGTINNRSDNEEMGPEVARMFDVITDYRYLFVEKNYVFYRIEEKYIRVVNIYHEKEDFIWQLFGIATTPQETIAYWKE